MALITMEEQQEFAVAPDDSILLLKVDQVDVVEMSGARGPWQKLNIKFKVLEVQAVGDGGPISAYDSLVGGPIFGNVPFRLTDSPENKLRQWVEAIFNMELTVGFVMDTDLLLNKTVRGITSTYRTTRTIDPSTGQGYLRHQIESLLPYGQSTGVAPQAQPDPWLPTGPTATGASFGGSSFADEPPF